MIARFQTAGVLALGSLLVAASGAAALSQLPGAAGCVSQGAGAKSCAPGRAMAGPVNGVAISPDGRSAYLPAAEAGGVEADAIDVFDRDPATGALAQKPGVEGCISELGKEGCGRDGLLKGVGELVVSPDGKNVYAATDAGVVVFDRDLATGALAQKPGVEGCLTSLPGLSSSCEEGTGLAESISIAISPDGRSVYATSGQHAVVAVLVRDPASGALRQLPGAAGCVSAQPGPGACPTGPAPEGVTTSVVVSPDGRSVYAASDHEGVDSVAIFTRDPSTGVLTHNHGRSGCVAQDRRAGCLRRRALRYITDLAISSDGRNVYVATGYPGPGAVAIFERRPNGALTQRPGRAGCVSENGSHGDCRKERALSQAGELAVSPDGGNLYVASLTGLSILVRHQSGALTQDRGKSGCVSSFNRKCQRARAIEAATGVAVSPDAADVYVTSVDFNSVVALRR